MQEMRSRQTKKIPIISDRDFYGEELYIIQQNQKFECAPEYVLFYL
jgi:hypothetical protein